MEDIKKEKYISSSPESVSLEGTKEIIEQMKNSVCRIYNNGNGTGFFTKIPYKTKLLPVLITNNHIITKDDILNNKVISLRLNNDKITKAIKLDKNRLIYTNEILDVTIIEIKKDEDCFNNKYLELDDEIINYFKFNKKEQPNYIKEIYSNKSIYLIGYPEDRDVVVSYGEPPNFDLSNESKIFHKCNTKEGASGSPILLINNQKLIGIHYGCLQNFNVEYNNGTLLIYAIIEFSKIGNNLPEIKKDNNINYLIPSSSSNKNDNNYEFDERLRDSGKDLSICKHDSNNDDMLDGKEIKNFDSDKNLRLNSIMKMLIAIGEIKANLLNPDSGYKKNSFKMFDKIYILISFLKNALPEIYPKENINLKKSLEDINIILNFLNKDISRMNTYDFLLFVLNNLIIIILINILNQ